MSRWMQIIARASAFLLLLGVIILVITGWGITQTGVIYNLSHGLIDRRTADSIHRGMNLPLVIFFLAHVMSNIKIALYRRRATENWLINGLIIGFSILVLAAVVYMEYFRRGG
jgi:hypothetical protein